MLPKISFFFFHVGLITTALAAAAAALAAGLGVAVAWLPGNFLISTRSTQTEPAQRMQRDEKIPCTITRVCNLKRLNEKEQASIAVGLNSETLTAVGRGLVTVI